ncbi:F-box protein [Neochlamydia sp. S13]|uniref:F-box protein n=1 Tax=Neochlamydia sp. S13 TaxID=1353976 RepID=UPI0005A96CC5|nr:F-box protein [Neochlamydia sp. S13]BBI16240.1 hypothetical protein NCS13_1_0045 [Neochlamydia sp. S13]
MVNTLTNTDNHKNGTTISPNDSTVTSIKQLPNELLLHIFSFLQALDLLEVELTCHRWKNLAEDKILWKNLYPKHLKIYWHERWESNKKSYFITLQEEREDEKLMAFLGSIKHVHNLELAKFIGLP